MFYTDTHHMLLCIILFDAAMVPSFTSICCAESAAKHCPEKIKAFIKSSQAIHGFFKHGGYNENQK